MQQEQNKSRRRTEQSKQGRTRHTSDSCGTRTCQLLSSTKSNSLWNRRGGKRVEVLPRKGSDDILADDALDIRASLPPPPTVLIAARTRRGDKQRRCAPDT